MANWESEIREAILRHGQFPTTCLEQDPVKRNRDYRVKNWHKNNPDKVKKSVEKWRKKNPGKQSGYQKKWAAKNPDYLEKESRAHFAQAIKLDGELKELINTKQEKE